MKRDWKKIGLLCLSMLLTACGAQNKEIEQEKLTVVSSFYPIYLLAQEVTAGSERVQLLNMAQPQTGCLHDYELTIADMKILEQADVLLINGGGMESFLEQALERYPALQVVDTSHGIELLEAGTHHHHEEEAHEEEVHAEEADPHEGHDHEENPHIWLSPARAAAQAEEMAEALGELVQEEAALFHANAEAFHHEVHELEEAAAKIALPAETFAAVFHEGFGYLAELFHMEPAVELFADEYQIPSARELVQAAEEAAAHEIRFYLTAADNGQKYAKVLAAEQGEQIILLDPLTTQDTKQLSYTERMKKNIEAVKAYELKQK